MSASTQCLYSLTFTAIYATSTSNACTLSLSQQSMLHQSIQMSSSAECLYFLSLSQQSVVPILQISASAKCLYCLSFTTIYMVPILKKSASVNACILSLSPSQQSMWCQFFKCQHLLSACTFSLLQQYMLHQSLQMSASAECLFFLLSLLHH